VTLISTEAMLVARDDLPPALINLLLEAAAVRIRVPASHASEAYTLREHIALVRRAIEIRQQVTGNREQEPQATGIRDRRPRLAQWSSVGRARKMCTFRGEPLSTPDS